MSLTPVKKTTIIKTSALSTAGKSQQNTPVRASVFNNVREIPLDPKSHYTISYVPGMVEHDIDTGKTHEDARMKIVLLTCELERVNTFNYSLVKENEVLRVQANKSERERDLETKLAIVLAENEKLNQVIEEVYEVYMSQRGFGSNEEYEQRIAELYEDLDNWKVKYNVLEGQGNIVQLQNAVTELQTQRDLLTEQLARKDRDLETMRARLTSLEDKSPESSRNRDASALAAENEVMKKDLETLRLKFGKADALQLKLNDYDNKIRTILGENEKLNDLIATKIEEIRELRYRLEEANHAPQSKEVFTYSNQLAPVEHKKKASAMAGDDSAAIRTQAVLKENDDLRQELQYLKTQVGNAHEFEERLQIIMGENQRLVNLIQEKERELGVMRDTSNSSRESQIAAERLTDKIRQLLAENDNLHRLLDEGNFKIAELQKDSALAQNLTEKIIMVSQENERLLNLVELKKKEIEGLNRRIIQGDGTRINVESYEERIRVLSIEVRQANDLASERQREVNSLKSKVYEVQSNSNQVADLQTKFALVCSENERLGRELESTRLKVRDDKTAELQQQVSFLLSEKYRLEAAAREREGQENLRNSNVRTYEFNLNELRGQNEQLKNAGVEQKKKISDLEARIAMLVTLESRVSILNAEYDKLQRTIIDKESQIQTLSQRLSEREREADDLRKRVTGADSMRVYEIEDIRAKSQAEQEKKVANLRAEMEVEVRKLVQEKKEIEGRAIYASSELQGTIQTLKAELENWKLRCTELENSESNNVEVEQLKRQFEALKAMNLQVKDLQQKFGAERAAYETQILQLGQIIQDLEYQKEMLATENERITGLSIQRLSHIEELRVNSNEESHKLEIHQLRNELERVKASSYDVKQLTIKFNTEKAADKSKINELMQINASYKSDIEKLQSLMEQRKTDIESVNKQNEDLRKICERLNQQNRSSIVSSNVETIEILQTRVIELEKSRNDYQRQAERNTLELTRKNRELVDKIQELDVIKLKYEEALANYQALNNQVFARLSVKH